MNLSIKYSEEAYKYMKRHRIHEKIRETIGKYIAHLKGGTVIPDIQKMRGKWEGYFRLRAGDLRIFIKPNMKEGFVYVLRIGTRGDIYKKN